MKNSIIFKHTLTNGIFWGLIGGLILVLCFTFFRHNVTAIIGLSSYTVCVVASVLTIQLNETDNKYVKMYFTSLLTFVVIFMSLYIHGYILHGAERGYNWIGTLMMSIVGIFSCALLTFLVTRNR